MAATFIQSLFERRSEAARREMFERLLRQTHRSAYSFAVRLTNNPNEAEDLVQDAYVRAYRFFDRYDESLPFTNWLYRIIANSHVDMIRRRGKLKTVSMDHGGQEGDTAWEIPDGDHGPEDLLLNDLMDDRVQDGIAQMTPEFRTAVLLADVEGLSYEEIADIMETSVGTVRSRIHRGRKQLRGYLTKNAPQIVARFAE